MLMSTETIGNAVGKNRYAIYAQAMDTAVNAVHLMRRLFIAIPESRWVVIYNRLQAGAVRLHDVAT